MNKKYKGKRVLYLGGFDLPDKNAAAQRVMSNAILLKKIGFEVIMLGLAKDNCQSKFEVSGISCNNIQYPKNTKEWLYHITNYIPTKEIDEYNPNYVILYNFPALASIKILRHCKQRGIKVFQDLTEWEQTVGKSPRDIIKRIDTFLRMKFCIKKMDGVIAISAYLYNYCKNKVKTIMVPPTVDLSDPKWDRGRAFIVNNPISLVYAGSPGAGVKDRLDIIIGEVVKNSRLNLKVVGLTVEQFHNAFKLVPQHYENVCFLGRLSHLDTVKEICNADFQMLIRDNNKKNNAGFPTKLVESLSCCTPVISTVYSNVAEYVKDGYNGFIIDERQSLKDCFERVCELSKEDITSMKKHCKEINKFDYNYYEKEFVELFS